MAFERITVNPERMGGKPCMRDLRVTVTMVLGQLSPSVAAQLRAAGHDAVHVIDVERATATDPEIVEHTEANDVVIVTVDTDFPTLIALRRSTRPSIVQLRGVNELPPNELAALVIADLAAVADDLQRRRDRFART